MIDKAGYRYGVGIILINDKHQVFFAKRIGMIAWQFPQGGMQESETPEETMYRELKEEVGLNPEDVQIISSTRRWLRYKLPSRLVRHYAKPLCIGQKQKWFLLKLVSADEKVDLQSNDDPEFDEWRWVSYWYPLKQVVTFKRRVYVMVLKEFAKLVLSKRHRNQSVSQPAGEVFQQHVDAVPQLYDERSVAQLQEDNKKPVAFEDKQDPKADIE